MNRSCPNLNGPLCTSYPHCACGSVARATKKTCTDFTPPWFTGRWRDWHRGHGCDQDDGKFRTSEGQREIDDHEADASARKDS